MDHLWPILSWLPTSLNVVLLLFSNSLPLRSTFFFATWPAMHEPQWRCTRSPILPITLLRSWMCGALSCENLAPASSSASTLGSPRMCTNLVGWLGARLFGQWQARGKNMKTWIKFKCKHVIKCSSLPGAYINMWCVCDLVCGEIMLPSTYCILLQELQPLL